MFSKNARNEKFKKMQGMESLKKFTGWNISKNARNGKFKIIHGIGSFLKKEV